MFQNLGPARIIFKLARRRRAHDRAGLATRTAELSISAHSRANGSASIPSESLGTIFPHYHLFRTNLFVFLIRYIYQWRRAYLSNPCQEAEQRSRRACVLTRDRDRQCGFVTSQSWSRLLIALAPKSGRRTDAARPPRHPSPELDAAMAKPCEVGAATPAHRSSPRGLFRGISARDLYFAFCAALLRWCPLVDARTATGLRPGARPAPRCLAWAPVTANRTSGGSFGPPKCTARMQPRVPAVSSGRLLKGGGLQHSYRAAGRLGGTRCGDYIEGIVAVVGPSRAVNVEVAERPRRTPNRSPPSRR